MEVVVRCDVLRGYLNRVAGSGEQGEGVRRVVEALGGVAVLWLGRAEAERRFGHLGDGSRGYAPGRVRSGCAACVLAIVGGQREVLVALRASMVARAKGKAPRLLGLVDAWMQVLDARDMGREMMAESEALAEEVREARSWMRARRAERRTRMGEGVGNRGRSKHRGGLPVETRVVDGSPMPRFKLRGYHHQHHGNSHPDPYPIGNMDGAEDAILPARPPTRHQAPARPDYVWSSSISRNLSSPGIQPETNTTTTTTISAFIPPRAHWPQQNHRTAAQANPVPAPVPNSHQKNPNQATPTHPSHPPFPQQLDMHHRLRQKVSQLSANTTWDEIRPRSPMSKTIPWLEATERRFELEREQQRGQH
jgi:hypothetical protein